MAAILGRTAGIGLIGLGIYQFVSGNRLGGVLLVFIGLVRTGRRQTQDVRGD